MKVNSRIYKGMQFCTDDGIMRNFRVDMNTIYLLEEYNVELKELDDFKLFMILYCGVKHELPKEIDIEIFDIITRKCFKELKNKVLKEYVNCMIFKVNPNDFSKKEKVNDTKIDFDYLFYIHEVVLRLKGNFWRKTPSYLFSMIDQHRKFNQNNEDEKKRVSIDEAF